MVIEGKNTYKNPNANINSNITLCDSGTVMRTTTGTGSAKIRKSVTMWIIMAVHM